MNILYHRAKESIQNKGHLAIHNVKDLVNTIIRRKPLIVPSTIVMADLFYTNCLCCGKRKLFSKRVERRRRQFTKATQMLDRGFDVTNLLKTINLT